MPAKLDADINLPDSLSERHKILDTNLIEFRSNLETFTQVHMTKIYE